MRRFIREYDLPLFMLLLLFIAIACLFALVWWDVSTTPLRYCIEVPR